MSRLEGEVLPRLCPLAVDWEVRNEMHHIWANNRLSKLLCNWACALCWHLFGNHGTESVFKGLSMLPGHPLWHWAPQDEQQHDFRILLWMQVSYSSPGPGNTGFPCQAQGSESQDLTTVPPGEERTSWLTLSLEAVVLLNRDGRRHLAVPQASWCSDTAPRLFQDQLTRRGGALSLYPLTMGQLHWNLITETANLPRTEKSSTNKCVTF